ncbi:hypothetical protein H4Q26_011140 [Puccinia striiformis f. sp. tritici PST-130]|nr:hypothetical protein H4Q26_011140 [Puccinia striiformis f. sp. tritici PST-130]
MPESKGSASMTTRALIDFVKNLPLSVNPYEATAEKIKQETRVAEPVLWDVFFDESQLSTSSSHSYSKSMLSSHSGPLAAKKANKLHFFRCNKLGLIHVEMLNEIVLLMFYFLSWLVSIWSPRTWLKGISCVFPVNHGNECHIVGYESARWIFNQTFASVCFASNGTLVALMFIPGALLLWRSIDGACAIRAIEDNSRKVIAHLLQSAPTYRPESYSYLSVVGIVKPLAAIVPYKNVSLTTSVYLQEILYCPPVVYLMFGPTTKVSKLSDPTWILVLQVGVHGPTAIIGNIILAFLIQNAVYAHKKHHELSIAPVNIQPEAIQCDS